MKTRTTDAPGKVAAWLGLACGLAVLAATWSPGMVAGKAGANPFEGKSMAELAAVLKDSPDEMTRHDSVQAIAASLPAKQRRTARPPKTKPHYASPDGQVVAVLVGGLSDKASSVRYACREALGRCGGPAVGPLVAALASDTADVRSYAADALGDVGVYDDADAQPLDQAVPVLATLLDDKDYAVRVSAAMALSRIGPRAAPALPKLIALLDDDEWAVADAAVQAVAAADPNGTRSAAALVKVLGSRKHDLREFICAELAEMGPRAEAAVPALIELLDADRGSWQAGKAAAGALAAIVSVDPTDPQALKVSDQTRSAGIYAIAKSAAVQKAPFMQDDRLFALLPKLPGQYGPYHYTGPLGSEALPALPLALQRLAKWMTEGTGWVPRRELVAFVGEVGIYAKDEATGAVKALLADKKLDPTARKELEGLLKKLAD